MSTHKQTILHLVATKFYGGPEKQIIEHLIRLDINRYRAVFASFLEYGNPNETLEKAKTSGLNHFGIPMFGPLDVRAQWKLTSLLRKHKVNLLCAHGYKACVMGWWSGFRCNIPVIAFSRGYTAEDKKVAFYEWLERRTLDKMCGIVFVSEGQRRKLESWGINGRKSWIVHNAISANSTERDSKADLRENVLQKLGIPLDSKLVVTAGRLSPEKGHKYLVHAIARMGEKSNNAHFVFCGQGVCQKDLEKEARRLGIQGRCLFQGFRRDLDEIFRAMDLLVLPSLTEGLPNVVLEAFACAKPVVASDVGGVPEVVENNVNGILLPPKRPDLLARAIQKCLESPELLNVMGQAGYQKVKSDFTFESQTRKLEKIYDEVLSK